MRSRAIRPEFFSDQKMNKFSYFDRFLYLSLIVMADDKGRGYGDIFTVKAFAFRSDRSVSLDDVKAGLKRLEVGKRIVLYKSDNEESYYCILKFIEHQWATNPSESKNPKPTLLKLKRLDLSDVQIEELRDDRPWNWSRGKRKHPEYDENKAQAEKETTTVFRFWARVHQKKKNIKFSQGRKKKIKARLNAGRTITELKQAIVGCRLSPFHMGENEQRKVYNELTLILRNDEKVDQFIDVFEQNNIRRESIGLVPIDVMSRVDGTDVRADYKMITDDGDGWS